MLLRILGPAFALPVFTMLVLLLWPVLRTIAR